jgi:hypothetical protein
VKHTAVAISAKTATYGFAYNGDSEADGNRAAYLFCQQNSYPHNDCVVFMSSVSPGYYAIAIGEGSHAVVVGGRKTAEDAQQAAVEQCNRNTKQCTWRQTWINGEVK